jgi:hypothetical protein
MTETALALRDTPSAVMLTEAQLNFIAKTEFVPKAFRGNLPAIMACVATGRSIGISDMNALRSIHIIDGKATFSAELMVQLVRAHGHSITGDVSGKKAVVRGRRADNGDEMTSTWTWEDAERAGLANRPSWKSYPDDMLWSRAVSRLCRRLFADCFAGATYTPEEGEFTADELMDETQPAADPPENVAEQVADDNEVELATEPQRRLIFAKAKEHGVEEPTLRAILAEFTGQESTAAIPRDRVDVIVEAIGLQQAAV